MSWTKTTIGGDANYTVDLNKDGQFHGWYKLYYYNELVTMSKYENNVRLFRWHQEWVHRMKNSDYFGVAIYQKDPLEF